MVASTGDAPTNPIPLLRLVQGSIPFARTLDDGSMRFDLIGFDDCFDPVEVAEIPGCEPGPAVWSVNALPIPGTFFLLQVTGSGEFTEVEVTAEEFAGFLDGSIDAAFARSPDNLFLVEMEPLDPLADPGPGEIIEYLVLSIRLVG